MSLWLDKYKPSTLDELDYHCDQAKKLKQIVSGNNFPHLLVYGPAGAGKKTRIHCLLRELYGSGFDKLRIEHREFVTPSNKKIEVSVVASNYHMEVNPSDAGLQDRVVVQNLIKDTASSQQLNPSEQKQFKVIVFHEVDRLSDGAQHALRRTMEKYIATCRLIFCAESITRVIPAIRSRCLPIRVPAPTNDEVERIIISVCKKENLQMPKTFAKRIALFAEGNLRRALLAAESCRIQQYPFSDDQKIEIPEWISYIKETAAMITAEQSPKKLLEVRARLYELISHCIPHEVILQRLADELVVYCDSTIKAELFKIAADYEYRMRLGQKAIFHLEAFVAKFMSIYKSFFDDVPMDDIW